MEISTQRLTNIVSTNFIFIIRYFYIVIITLFVIYLIIITIDWKSKIVNNKFICSGYYYE